MRTDGMKVIGELGGEGKGSERRVARRERSHILRPLGGLLKSRDRLGESIDHLRFDSQVSYQRQ